MPAGALDGLRLERLELYAPLLQEEADPSAVLTPTCLSSLSSLSIFGLFFGNEETFRMLVQRDLRRLRQLEVRDCHSPLPCSRRCWGPSTRSSPEPPKQPARRRALGDEGARLVAQRFPRLERLDMGGCGVTDEGARALAATEIAQQD